MSVVYANGKLKAYSTIDGKSFKESKELNQSINETNLNGATALGIGNWQNLGASSRYEGYLDEFRIFSRALTLDEIKQNYNHTLNGSEEGLQVYYPFDEGMENQKVAYDFSKQNGIANGHHASAPIAVVGQGNVVPSEDQLSLMTYTDQNGNYMLRGIPFAGEGTSYTIRPTLGIHEFSPTMENRFFNRNLAGGAMLDIGVYALSIVRSFMEEQPDRVVSQWLPAPTGVDEQATILLQNCRGQMATVALTMHSKQPKRAMISCEKGYIEIMEYPRADKAVITDAATGERREISAGETAKALFYELTDMEKAVTSGDAAHMKLGFSRDVMDIMTSLRNEWGLRYPEEE